MQFLWVTNSAAAELVGLFGSLNQNHELLCKLSTFLILSPSKNALTNFNLKNAKTSVLAASGWLGADLAVLIRYVNIFVLCLDFAYKGVSGFSNYL